MAHKCAWRSDPSTHSTCQKIKPPDWVVIFFGGSGWIRTTSVVRQQIYSLPRLSNSGARPKLNFDSFCPPPPRLRRDTEFSTLAIASVKIRGAGSGNRTRISSLEGLHTSLCTMPATNSKQSNYILLFPKRKYFYQGDAILYAVSIS